MQNQNKTTSSHCTTSQRLRALLLSGVMAAGIAIAHTTQAQVSTTWKLHARNASAQTAPEFGRSAAMNDVWIVIGEPGNDDAQTNSGAVHVFNAVTGVHIRKLANPSPKMEARFGQAISISGDMVLIGAPGGGTAGACYLINARTGALVKNVPAPLPENAKFGTCVALWGNRAAIGDKTGAPGGAATGTVHYYADITTAAAPMTFIPADLMSGDEWGSSIAMDDHYVLAGAPQHNGSAGAAYLYDTATGAKLTKFAGTGDERAGFSVAMAGGMAFVGAPFVDYGGFPDCGTVYQFEMAYGAGSHVSLWSQPTTGAMKGTSVAAWGPQAVAGSPGESIETISACGRADLFHTSDYEFLRKFVVADRGAGDALGTVVCVYRNGVLITAVGDDDLGTDYGAAYVLNNVAYPMKLTALAESGCYAPGLSDVKHTTLDVAGTTFGSSYVSGSDRVIYTTGLVGSGVPGGRGSGVFTTDKQTKIPSLVLASGEDLGGIGLPGVKAAIFSQFNARHMDRPLFQVKVAGAGVNPNNDALLMLEDGVSAFPLIRRGEVIPSFGGAALNSWSKVLQPHLDGTGLLGNLRLGAGVSLANDSVFFKVAPNGAFVSGLREGQMCDAGVPLGQILSADIDSNGSGVFCAQLQSPANSNLAVIGLVADNMANQFLVTRKGEDAPGVPGAVFSNFISETTADGGTRIFVRGTISGPGITTASNDGLWSFESGNPHLVIRTGAQVTGLPVGVVWSRIIKCWPDTTTTVMVLGQVRGPGVTAANDTVLWCRMANGPDMVMLREGDVVDGPGGYKLGPILRVENEGYRYWVQATLAGAPATSNELIFYGDHYDVSPTYMPLRRPFPRIRKGTLYYRPGAVASTLTSFSMTPSAPVEPMRLQAQGSPTNGPWTTLQLRYANGVREVVRGQP